MDTQGRRWKVTALRAALLPLVFAASAGNAHAAAEQLLHSFASDYSEGSNIRGLTLATDGTYYGAASNGVNGTGTLFKMTASGTVTVLYTFSVLDENYHNTDGYGPIGPLTLGPDGNLYGATAGGGSGNGGVLFKVTPQGQFTILHTFTNADGLAPNYNPVFATDGNLYGTTTQGGNNAQGTLYRLTPSGTYTVLHHFDSSDYSVASSGLAAAADGNLYGVNAYGGSHNGGAIMRVQPNGSIDSLFSFTASEGGGLDMSYPDSPLTVGPDGALYGHATYGGTYGIGGYYRVALDGTESSVYSTTFPNYTGLNLDGFGYAALTAGRDGNLYGTTNGGGAGSRGTFFKLTPGGSFTLLYTPSTSNSIDGYGPSGLVQDSDGNLLGTYGNGGPHGTGAVFKLLPNDPLSVSLSISPAEVPSGSPTTVTWSSTGATSCAGFGNVSGRLKGSKPASGSANFTPLLVGKYIAGMQCTDGNGRFATATTSVIVKRKPPAPAAAR